jgi:hypothetical protein
LLLRAYINIVERYAQFIFRTRMENFPMHRNMLMLLTALTLIFTSVRVERAHAQEPAGQAPTEKHIFTKDMTIYVSDFDLDAANVKVDSGGATGGVRLKIIESPRKREEQDPQAQAMKLADLMSKSIVHDLHKAGYKAQRLAAGESRPAAGAWVHGVFTEVNEGNRRQRAVLGFGAGQSTMDLYVTLTDLSQPEKPLYTEGKHDDSGKKVGAVVTMNPYVAAAKFVMEKNAPEKTVKKTASEISADVAKHLKEYEMPRTAK